MNKEKVICFVFSLPFAAFGIWLIQQTELLAIGVMFLIWANNISGAWRNE